MKYEGSELNRLAYEINISWDLKCLIENILDRIDNPNDDEDIFQAIDDELIYYDDQWLVLKEYCTPVEANWDYAIEEFIHTVFSVVSQLQKE